MSKARLVITAIEIEGRTVAEVVAAYGVSRSWVFGLGWGRGDLGCGALWESVP